MLPLHQGRLVLQDGFEPSTFRVSDGRYLQTELLELVGRVGVDPTTCGI